MGIRRSGHQAHHTCAPEERRGRSDTREGKQPSSGIETAKVEMETIDREMFRILVKLYTRKLSRSGEEQGGGGWEGGGGRHGD